MIPRNTLENAGRSTYTSMGYSRHKNISRH